MNSLFINETALHTRLLHPPPLPLLPLLQAGGVARGGGDGRLWPPPPGGARFYFASLLLWDTLAPAKVKISQRACAGGHSSERACRGKEAILMTSSRAAPQFGAPERGLLLAGASLPPCPWRKESRTRLPERLAPVISPR